MLLLEMLEHFLAIAPLLVGEYLDLLACMHTCWQMPQNDCHKQVK